MEKLLVPPTEAEHLEAALAKIRKACGCFDKLMQDKVALLRSMEIGTILPKELRSMLSHIFGVQLTKGEIVALTKSFDRNNDGDVSFVEFRRALLKIIETSKQEVEERRKRESAKARKRHEKLSELHLKKHAANTVATVDSSFKDKDVTAALRKIAKAAATFDQGRSGNPLGAFAGVLDPTGFRDALWSVFQIKLTPPQLGAMMSHFDNDASGTVDGAEFKLEFCRIAGVAKQAMKEANERQKKKVKDYYDAIEAKQVEKFAKVPETKYDKNFSDKHYERAMSKLGQVAKFHDPERAQSTVGFQGLLDPGAFKEQLRRCFGIKFTEKELGALIMHFDRDDSGSIDGTEFLIGFYGLAAKAKAAEKDRVLAANEERQRKLAVVITKNKKKNKVAKRPVLLEEPSTVDRVKTAAALEFSSDIRLGKLLTVSTERVYGRDPRPESKRKASFHSKRSLPSVSLPPLATPWND
jgi:Ca2+-binding EF-hand superfamily protein